MTQHQILVPDVWSIIFSNLAPCFLADVTRVSRSFNNIASSDTTFFKKLQRYFPNDDLQAIPIPDAERHRGKFLFRTLYAKKFATLKSSTSRRLLSYIIEEDIEQIRKFPVDGDKLFEMLKEEDADGNDMLFYANRTKNTALLGELIKLYLRHEINIIQSWNPLTILDNWIDKFFRKILGLPLNTHEVIHLFTLAAAFNLDIIRLITENNRDFQWIYDDALEQAVRFDHIETIKFLLREAYDHFKGENGKFGIYGNHPLVSAAKYDRMKSATLLLEFEKISADLVYIKSALTTAIRCHSTSVFDLLLTAYLVHLKNDNMNVHAFMKTYYFNEIIKSGHADLVETILRRVVDLNNVEFKDVISRAIRQAIYAGNIEVIKVFLMHGYIPRSYDCYTAQHDNKPEIAEILREARKQYKQSNSIKLGM